MEKEVEKTEEVSTEDLSVLKDLQRQQEVLNLQAEVTGLRKKLADVSYENTLLKVYLKYGLSASDSFDIETGKILKKEEEKDETVEES